jgi:hypothetical protein
MPASRAPTVQARGRSRQRVALYVALAVVALVVVLAIIGAANRGDTKHRAADQPATSTAPGGQCTSDTNMDHYSSKDNGGVVHTDSPSYAGPLTPHNRPVYTVNPPSGGDHLSIPVPPGDYEGARVPPDGNLVHSLEHGYVIIWFKPTLSAQDKATLRSVRQQFPRDVLLVERATMDSEVAATAWGHRLLCTGVDKGALAAFVKDFRNQAPEKVPH